MLVERGRAVLSIRQLGRRGGVPGRRRARFRCREVSRRARSTGRQRIPRLSRRPVVRRRAGPPPGRRGRCRQDSLQGRAAWLSQMSLAELHASRPLHGVTSRVSTVRCHTR
eukprot:scaffold16284_cov56-Phaeocystis_antarctica.AAC.3